MVQIYKKFGSEFLISVRFLQSAHYSKKLNNALKVILTKAAPILL
jgi:hypothetical protein